MRVSKVRQSCHGGRWETIRYALDSDERTIWFCFIWIVLITSSALAAAVALRGGSATISAVIHATSWFVPFFR